jgi:hypothetical protein
MDSFRCMKPVPAIDGTSLFRLLRTVGRASTVPAVHYEHMTEVKTECNDLRAPRASDALTTVTSHEGAGCSRRYTGDLSAGCARKLRTWCRSNYPHRTANTRRSRPLAPNVVPAARRNELETALVLGGIYPGYFFPAAALLRRRCCGANRQLTSSTDSPC